MKQRKLFQDDKEPFDLWGDSNREPLRKKKTKPIKRYRNKEEYYKSEEWHIKRTFALHRANHRCQRCGRSKSLDVHHLTYDRLYNEHPEDLEVLCKKCHDLADKERAEETRFNNALDTYATKKYGEDWMLYYDEHYIEEEFQYWLEKKGW